MRRGVLPYVWYYSIKINVHDVYSARSILAVLDFVSRVRILCIWLFDRLEPEYEVLSRW